MALTNNDIIKKLRVALKLRDDEIVDILKLVDYETTKSEIGAFFRNPDHPKYMPLQDQILRNFLNGLVIHKRGPMEKREPVAKKSSDYKKESKPEAKTESENQPKAERVAGSETKRFVRPKRTGTISRRKSKD